MKLTKNENGTVTIYLVIVFLAMFAFTGLFIDLARIKAAQNQLRRVANGSARSVLADYNTGLRSGYMLFGARESDYHTDFAKYVRVNTVIPADREFGLLDYRYEGSGVVLTRPVETPEVLKGQILEAMKYRAPVEAVRGMINKFRQARNMAGLFDRSNEHRKSLARIDECVENIHRNNQNIKQAKKGLKAKKKHLAAVRRERAGLENTARSDGNRLRELKQQQKDLEQDIQETRTYIGSEVDKTKASREEIEQEFKKLEEQENSDIYEVKPAGTPGTEPDIPVFTGPGESVVTSALLLLEEELAGIDRDVVKTEEALKAEAKSQDADEGVFAQIGIETATNAFNRREDSRSAPVSSGSNNNTGHEAFLRRQIETVSREEGKFDAYFTPEPVEGNLKNFEKTGKQKADDIAKLFRNIFGTLNVAERLVQLRDEIYINEYVLTYFSSLTNGPKGNSGYRHSMSEAEYICYGGKLPEAAAVSELYFTRFALDSAAYFAFSKAPADLLVRTVYSMMMGALEAAADTYKLLVTGDTVPVASMSPGNPLENIPVDYREHLRLFLLLNGDEEGKLARISELIRKRSGVNTQKAYTMADAYLEVSIPMWFLPLAGVDSMKNGPFGTTIKDGRCYIVKRIEYEY